MLPQYLAVGMSLTEYFEGDALLTKYFRQAYRIKQEQEDYNAWLMGVYVLKAVDTALYNNPPLMKREREPRNYFETPLTYNDETELEVAEEENAKKQEEAEAKMAVWLENFVNFYGGENK